MDVGAKFEAFKNQWIGGRVDFDKEFGYQCVDLIRQWLYEEFGVGNSAGGVPNAISYWTITPPALVPWRVSSNAPEIGDIVVLIGLAGNSDGHIVISTGGLNATQFEGLEQNGSTGSGDGLGGNAVRIRWIERNRIAGVLRSPLPPPPPAPESVVTHPYTIEAVTTKQVKLNKDTHLWNLNYDNITEIENNPQADAIVGTVITVSALLHHNIGYNYYLSDPNVASGYNIVDCDDYTPPPPAGQMPLPSSETYDLVIDLPGYTTSNQAINHTGTNVIVPAGSYFVFNKRFDSGNTTELWAVNVTKTNGMAGAWINALDNVEPAPEPPVPPGPEVAVPPEPAFAGTYIELPKPEVYVAMVDVPVVDLAGSKTVTMPQYSVTEVAGMFVVNGIRYARPKSAADKNLWFGIELVDRQTGLPNIELESEVYNAKTTVADRQATHTLKTEDKLALVVAHAHNIYLGIRSFLSKIKKGK